MAGDVFRIDPAGRGGSAVPAGAVPILDQPFDSGTLYALRAAVQAHAGRAGMPPGRAGDMLLALHELAANAIVHGAGQGRLRIWRVAGVLSCEVLDGGLPDPDGRAGPGGLEADPWPAVDGHGLWLVRQVADRLELLSGPHGTRALVTFALPPRDH